MPRKGNTNLTKRLPTELFEKLPTTIQAMSGAYDNAQDQELATWASMTAMSSVCYNVVTHFERREKYPHSKLLVIGNKCTGKGVMGIGQVLIQPIDEYLTEQAGEVKKTDIIPTIDLGGNITDSFIFKQLEKNQNKGGLITSSELETLVNASKNPMGSEILTIIKHSEHHERYKVGRGSEDRDRYITIPKPKIALLMSGTYNQLNTLLTNTNKEGGFLDRMNFYLTEDNGETNIQFNHGLTCTTEQLTDISKELLDIFKFMEARLDNPLRMILTQAQEQELNEMATNYTSKLLPFLDDAKAIVMRKAHSFIAWLATLSTIRIGSEGLYQLNSTTVITPTDDDFFVAQELLKQQMYFYSFICHKYGGYVATKGKKIIPPAHYIIALLPHEFKTADYLAIAKEQGVSRPTAERQLAELLEKKIITKRDKQGYYVKTIKPTEKTN